MNSFNLSLVVHLLGLIFWISGLLFLTRALKCFPSPESYKEPWLRFVQRTWSGFVLPGFGLTLASGLFQFLSRGAGFYMQQGWFHGKLTVVLVLVVITIVLGFDMKLVESRQPINPKKMAALHGIVSLGVFAILCFTYLLRGYA